ncbi:MarR family winged helix-turn-helix transcriptional regulator [Geodermatophilus sp. URMC 62]|uniref:MarR family winged helix-turn-helix transcriptional regulator n=1 Tax=Geodermatophilus sp. URMC 62 TaxID=3423414 RepID=UPI00406C02E5
MSAPPVDEHLADVLVRLGTLTAPDDGPSRTAAATLARLERQSATRVTELAASEGVAQPSMSALVARLTAQGLVRRGGDARVVLLGLTEAGATVLARRRARRSARLDAALAALSPDEVRRIADALPALASLAAALRRPDPTPEVIR